VLRRGALSATLGAVVCLAACASGVGEDPAPAGPRAFPALEPPRAEILWDTYGVPHVFARDIESLLFAFGWAQMQNHADLLLRLYGQARGRAAEYWGEGFTESDRWVRVNGVPGRAREWLAAQTAEERVILDAFTRGINAYAREHPDDLDAAVRVVLPVEPADILAHAQRVVHFTFVAPLDANRAAVRAWQAGSPVPESEPAGASNGWAVAPVRSASGNALLLANPHLPWSDLFTWLEAHLVAPGIDATGAALVGFPLPGIAFNDRLGWTFTVNPIDAADLYELAVEGGGYLWDGNVRAFETRQDTLRIRGADGTVRTERLTVRSSVHGPIVAERSGRALALRVAGLDAPHLIQQTWEMLRARNLAQFESALSRLQIPLFNVIYADADGHILYVFNGRVPVRPRGDWRDWNGIVRGDSSVTLWTTTHAYGDLPRVIDPPAGWLHNANDPPWTSTFPAQVDPSGFPAYVAPVRQLAFRPQRSARMLREDERIGFDEIVAYKHSTRMEAADHLVDDVVVAARASASDVARRAATVLAAWDRHADADSRGAVLFQAFFLELNRRATGEVFQLPWSERAPFTTPDGLADPAMAVAALAAAAGQVQERHGALDVAWGEVYRLRRDSVDLPGNGGPGALGIFRVTDYQDAGNGQFRAAGGDSWVAAIEFSSPVRAQALLPYGNASQPGSPHRVDQLTLYSEQRLRPVWRVRTNIEANSVGRRAFRDSIIQARQ
jgi:acyl-homoserine-lactone acylase